MDIAFLYIAEAYQCYHGAAIALELAGRSGVRVQNFHNDPETPSVLARISAAYGVPDAGSRRLSRRPLTRLLQSAKRLGMQKTLTLWDNRTVLDRFDAIVAVEDTAALARRVGIARPRLIYYPHGFGDRARGFAPMMRRFDQVLVSGPRTAERMLAEKLIRPDNHAIVGPVKLETGERLGDDRPPLFVGSDRPLVLYNAHKAPGLSSWSRFVEPMLAGFASQDRFDLVVAPHVKMFRRRSEAVRAAWTRRGTGNILVDVGSERLLDMSYTRAASIYVGDVSSQVYEFLQRPRPCVFLNAAGVDWRNDPSFAHWHLGEVVDDPSELMAAIARAPERHACFRARQEQQAAAALGSLFPVPPSVRAADAILSDGIALERLQWLPELPHGRFMADPFGLWRDGSLHVFVEAFDYRERIGHIDVLRFDADLTLLDQRTVLRRPWHLSYPVVFEAEGEVWMLPEAFQSGTLTLYRAKRFPFDWEPVCDLPLDGPAIDATPLFHDGLWWLFYTPGRIKAARRSHLHLASAPALRGPWRTHPANPVLVDESGARPGGTVFERNGTLVLPVQDCRATYGHAIRALEITRLDMTCFSATHREHLPAPGWMAPYADGLHTLSAAGPVTLIDVKRMDGTPRGTLGRLAGIVRQRVRRSR